MARVACVVAPKADGWLLKARQPSVSVVPEIHQLLHERIAKLDQKGRVAELTQFDAIQWH